MIDTLLIISASLCMIVGLIGSIAPFLPGPPVSYLGLILLHLSTAYSFSPKFLLIYAVLTILVVVVDSLIPVYGTKWFKGSKYGFWGSAFGLAAGLFLFAPAGIIIGPVIGALLGELLSGKKALRAFRSALGSFFGFLAGTVVKVILSIAMTVHFVRALL
jgi:uncharacterized protein